MSQMSALHAIVMADRAFKEEISQRIDTLIQLQAQAAAVQPKVVWDCPVCGESLTHLRSFKGHIKRLWEVYCFHGVLGDTSGAGGSHHPPSEKKRCVLRANSSKHVNLVSRSGPPGSDFKSRSTAFATALWQYVSGLTSSDDDPEVMSGFTGFNGYDSRSTADPAIDNVTPRHAHAASALGDAPM